MARPPAAGKARKELGSERERRDSGSRRRPPASAWPAQTCGCRTWAPRTRSTAPAGLACQGGAEMSGLRLAQSSCSATKTWAKTWAVQSGLARSQQRGRGGLAKQAGLQGTPCIPTHVCVGPLQGGPHRGDGRHRPSQAVPAADDAGGRGAARQARQHAADIAGWRGRRGEGQGLGRGQRVWVRCATLSRCRQVKETAQGAPKWSMLAQAWS